MFLLSITITTRRTEDASLTETEEQRVHTHGVDTEETMGDEV